MDESVKKQPEVVEATEFDPANYAGRDVVFVKVPAAQGMGREVNFFGLKLRASIDESPLLIGLGGAGVLGWEALTTRKTIGKMLMTDDEFAKSFRDGALMDIRERNLDAFTRYFSRESTITQMIPDAVNRYKLQWKLGDEVKARGVGTLEAMSKWRFGHWVKAAGALGAMGVGFGAGLGGAAKPDEKEPAAPQSLFPEDAPNDWRGKVFDSLKSQAQTSR
jgi:hypothetical protein